MKVSNVVHHFLSKTPDLSVYVNPNNWNSSRKENYKSFYSCHCWLDMGLLLLMMMKTCCRRDTHLFVLTFPIITGRVNGQHGDSREKDWDWESLHGQMVFHVSSHTYCLFVCCLLLPPSLPPSVFSLFLAWQVRRCSASPLWDHWWSDRWMLISHW